MSSEKEVQRKIDQYQELGEKNKNIDVAALMINALEQAQRDEIETKKKHRAYLVSVGLPPFGLLYAIRYYFSDKDDGKKVALICAILTVCSLLVAWGIGALMFSGSGADTAQLQSVSTSDLKALFQ